MVKLPPLLKFLALTAVPVVMGWRALLGTFWLASENEAYTYILLILPITLGMVYLEWPAVRPKLAPGWRAGSILLVAASLTAGFAKWKLSADVRLSICTLAVVLWWIGAFVGCLGTRASKSLLFPLCFLFWLVPLPAFLLNAILGLLQHGSAYAARMLFVGAGVPVAQAGVVLTIPGLTVEVAQECSSIRSSMILLVTTMVLAQLFLRSPWRKALVIGFAIPLSVAKNGLRIFTIAMLGTRVDPGFLTGWLHHHGGVIFLAMALAVIFFLLWILREDKGARRQEAQRRPAISPARK